MMHSGKGGVSKAAAGTGVNRRNMLLGGTALAAAVAVPGAAQAAIGFLQDASAFGKRRSMRRGEGHLGKYLCGEVHQKIALRLDDIIADPAIDGEGTAKALMEARCPGCGERVHPATSALSAVVPQWQWQERTA